MTFYRNSAFIIKGLREFCRSGYESAAKNFKPEDLSIDLSSQSFMITGANSGIGKCTAYELAKRGGTVHMVCRSEARGQEAQKEIKESSGNEKVHLHIVDMSQPKRVYEFATQFRESGNTLNVLVNNAGCMVNTREVTEDGLEKNFATNTLGTYILTMSLLPLLRDTPGSRVVTVSSGGMYTQKLSLSDMQCERVSNFDGTMVYAQNKRQQVVMTEMWAKSHPAVHFSVMHPGWADTPAVRTSMPGFHRQFKNRLRSPEQGADTLVWLSAARAVLQQPSGQFYLDRKPVAKHLSFAWTKSSDAEKEKLMQILEGISAPFMVAAQN
ncbi:dehydrogenase/reductase SDR family member 12-like [Acanthaster planci]|uniref:Dehydrogenase/reductase SDR family member 12-like n=1 Tax=Acanthaster planci TaxID=133434 RepID=A0A8B7ZE70_ACAPL|nr:dehydrogenase/reductase SDR family member 12-like [Acanthaster planci]XP_022103290.1 dehydrogenase/reductase SDR family member 12-like [Acanthaster planci]XP_022103291.1 dehydrogenase/reductase SDR family member 12-like [Acanthaster planci]XP_022103292.1 dehydrogenase/reductase SDR family member 12-like [Acanthaster planci]XP_022103293.1 dehydrogenase/reductase SDR family member 12-like [Acanthaster planci]